MCRLCVRNEREKKHIREAFDSRIVFESAVFAYHIITKSPGVRNITLTNASTAATTT